jgi:hypothetical protein
LTEEELDRLTDGKHQWLIEALREPFGADSKIAAAILMSALRREFGIPMKEEDQPKFMAALSLLPTASTAQPRVLRARTKSDDGAEPYHVARFVEGIRDYDSVCHFASPEEAEAYAIQFLAWFGEVTPPDESAVPITEFDAPRADDK